MKKTVYLITGGTGLLGSNIIKELVEAGEHVRALVRRGNPARIRIPHGVEVVEGDILHPNSLDDFFSTSSNQEIIVIHAASLITTNPYPCPKVYAVNVEGTKNIIKYCLHYKVKKLIYISSTSVIPELAHHQPMKEVKSHDPEKVKGYYSKTKAMATDLVLKATKEKGLDACVVYPSGILGPYDYGFGMITNVIQQMATGRLRFSIGGSFNSIDVRDLSKGILTCVKKGQKGETYNMTGQCYTFRQLLETICRVAGVKKPLLTIPLWFIRPFAALGTFYSQISKKNVFLTKFILYNLERNNNFDCDKAEKELGFVSRSLAETIEDTIAWLRAEGKLGG